jgi:hypothetical protein
LLAPVALPSLRRLAVDLGALHAVVSTKDSWNSLYARVRCLRELLGEIRLQPVGDEIYAEFETRPERIFLSERVASNCGCGDRI